MYIIYINTHKISVIQEKKKKIILTRVKGLKLYPLSSFKVPVYKKQDTTDFYIAVSV